MTAAGLPDCTVCGARAGEKCDPTAHRDATLNAAVMSNLPGLDFLMSAEQQRKFLADPVYHWNGRPDNAYTRAMYPECFPPEPLWHRMKRMFKRVRR